MATPDRPVLSSIFRELLDQRRDLARRWAENQAHRMRLDDLDAAGKYVDPNERAHVEREHARIEGEFTHLKAKTALVISVSRDIDELPAA